VNLSRLPFEISGVRRESSRIETVSVAIKGPDGTLLHSAIPKVAITKDANYWDDEGAVDLEGQVDLVAMIGHMLKTAPLAGFVVEGLTPYGRNISAARHRLMLRAVHSGLPVVRVGRGNTAGFVALNDPSFIGGSNLTATKARLLLMACLMKFGSLPPAADPDHPTTAEAAAIREKVAIYQTIFDTH
jgi:hypothetical protein